MTNNNKNPWEDMVSVGNEVIYDLYNTKIAKHIFPEMYPEVEGWESSDFVTEIKELVCDERLEVNEKIDGILMAADRYKNIHPEDIHYV